MLSKAKIKYIQSLHQKKNRQKERVFIAEGVKIVEEILNQNQFKVHSLLATESWINKSITISNKYKGKLTRIHSKELKKISTLKNPKEILALVEFSNTSAAPSVTETSLNLVLENIQDPGNMGTIIRIADWFGIANIFCSEGCVDVYNSKVIQATMGSFLRVTVNYTNLEQLFKSHSKIPVYGAVLGGMDIYKTELTEPGFLLIGNEGKGLSHPIQKYISKKITIPKQGAAESLNAAVATGILCSCFKRK